MTEGLSQQNQSSQELSENILKDRKFQEDSNTDFISQFRANGGVLPEGHFKGRTTLILHTKGAKSGQPRVNPLAYLDFEDKWYVIASASGSAKDPAWAHNLRAHPDVEIEVLAETHQATARELVGAERERVWAGLTTIVPVFAEFQAKVERTIPLFELAVKR